MLKIMPPLPFRGTPVIRYTGMNETQLVIGSRLVGVYTIPESDHRRTLPSASNIRGQ